MKRSYLIALTFIAASLLAGLGGVQADARPAAAPTAVPSPAALPTATPEPPDKAIPRLLNVLKTTPNDKDALTGLAQQYLGIGRADLALPLTQKLISLGARTAEVYYYDGFANEQLNRIPNAIADYEAASNVDPTNIGVLGSLTQVYLKTHRLSDAERIAKRAVTFNKTDRRAYINFGLVLASEAKYDDARTQFETAYKLDSSDVTPVMQIAQTYVAQKAYPQALTTVDRAIAADLKNSQAYVFKGDILAAQHDTVNALAAYEIGVANAPDDDARVGIIDHEASYLASEKKTAEAEATFQRAISKYPASTEAHIALGDYYNSANHLDKAVPEWTLGLGPSQDNPAALIRLGTYYLRTNHPTQAIGFLKKLVSNNADPQALAALGQAYTQAHDYGHAREACQASYQANPQPDTLACIAGADFELKNYKESAKIFDVLDAKVHQFLDQSPQLLFVAGKVYENTNQKGKAVAEYNRLLKIIKPGTPAYKQVQQIIVGLSKPSKATKTKHG